MIINEELNDMRAWLLKRHDNKMVIFCYMDNGAVIYRGNGCYQCLKCGRSLNPKHLAVHNGYYEDKGRSEK